MTGLGRGLSARLLWLTIGFVMLSEVLVYAPSIARFREDYLIDRLASAHLATLALEATPDNMVSEELSERLLDQVDAHVIAVRHPGDVRRLLARRSVPMADYQCDLGAESWFELITDAFGTLLGDGSRTLRIIGPSRRDPAVTVEVLIDEAPLRAAMISFSGRILGLSLLISGVTAMLVFLSLQLMMVGPMRRLARNMVAFRAAPEVRAGVITASTRRDEIGEVTRELAAMEEAVRAALAQKTRLAALGTAVAKINHDLRNILATVQLLSDRVAQSSDPGVLKIAPSLLAAVDRAIQLCTRTLDYARDEPPPPQRARVRLAALIDEAAGVSRLLAGDRCAIETRMPPGIEIAADRDQLFRVLVNLMRNAAEAGARQLRIAASIAGEDVSITLSDDGPGLPPRARENLFQPFTGSARSGGTGLGLAIARELVRAHDGDLTLVSSTAAGTEFRIDLPRALRGLDSNVTELRRPA